MPSRFRPRLAVGLIAVLALGLFAGLDVRAWLLGGPAAAVAVPLPQRHLLGATAAETDGRPWIATWGAAPQAAAWLPHGLDAVTVRNVVTASAGGDTLRVRLTNAFGRRPLRIGAASIAHQAAGAGVTDMTALTFHGRRAVTLPPGADMVSDPAPFALTARERIAISLFLARPTPTVTGHRNAEEHSFIAPGDRVLDREPDAFATRTASWYFVAGVAVLGRPGDRAIVALGDSITDGVGSGVGAEARWPDALSRRLLAAGYPGVGVVDAGIGGNRVLHAAPCCGVSALARVRPDVLQRAGVRTVVLMEGLNDIGLSRTDGALSAPHTPVTAAQIIAGQRRLVARAHAAGLRVLGGTLTPFRGAGYWSRAGEAEREAVNRWVRSSGELDGVIEFARAVADPADPSRLRPAYDSGDHLHPNAAGYRAMAAAVDLGAVVGP